MSDSPPTLIHYRGNGLGDNACGAANFQDSRSWNPGEVTCFACRQSAVFKQELAKRDPVQIGEVLRNLPQVREIPLTLAEYNRAGVGEPTPPITFEFETGSHHLPLVPLLAAFEQIKRDRGQAGQYDIVEWRRHNFEDKVVIGIHLWLWPRDRSTKPQRVWILQDGTVDMEEDVDWLDDSEWPEHIK